MTGAGKWSDDRYTPDRQAYDAGEYDGYWGRELAHQNRDNKLWQAYLRGYAAGVRDRATEPSDAQIDLFLRNINEALKGEDR